MLFGHISENKFAISGNNRSIWIAAMPAVGAVRVTFSRADHCTQVISLIELSTRRAQSLVVWGNWYTNTQQMHYTTSNI